MMVYWWLSDCWIKCLIVDLLHRIRKILSLGWTSYVHLTLLHWKWRYQVPPKYWLSVYQTWYHITEDHSLDTHWNGKQKYPISEVTHGFLAKKIIPVKCPAKSGIHIISLSLPYGRTQSQASWRTEANIPTVQTDNL